MTNIVVLADIHIDDFQSEHPGERLRNYLKLAEIIRDKAKELNAPWIFLAGDTLNRPVSPPHVLSVLNKFIETLLESGARIAFITGQHDQNVKELENLKDTYLGIFCSDKVFYANGKMLTIDGTKIYFENYTRSNSVDPARESDVFISHVTLGMQKVNNSKFKLGIFGDIHERVDIGNMHSVCPPLCVHAHEEPKGIIGILTVGDGEPRFRRFEYDPEFKIFPKLEREFREVKAKENLSEEDKEALKILGCNNFFKEIDEVVTKLGLEDIHRDIDMTNAPEPMSLDFRLTEVYARNFKSLKDVCFKFDDLGKIIFIEGSNGSGKTSIIEAIFTALLGDKHIDKFESKWSGPEGVMVGVKLNYSGHNYEICRGKGWTKFFIDNEEVTKANKTALDTYIYQVLPFLNVVWMFYIRTYEHFFDKDRVALVKKCFNLELFDYIYGQAKILLTGIKNSLSKSLERNNQLKGRYEQVKKQIESIKEQLKDFEDIDTGELQDLNSKLQLLNSKLRSKSLLQGKIETCKSQIASFNKQVVTDIPDLSKLELWKTTLKDIKTFESEIRAETRTKESLESSIKALKIVECPNCHEVFQLGGEAIESLKNKIEECKQKISLKEANIQKLREVQIPYSDTYEIDNLITKLNKQEVLHANIEQLNFTLKDLQLQSAELDVELSSLPKEEELRDKILKIERKKLLLQNKYNEEISQREIYNEAKSCQLERQSLNERISQCEKYINLFDIKNLDSIPYKLLVKISEFLSTDTIKFKTYSQLANGNLVLDISCERKVGDEFIDYDSCSHGQKTKMDLFILSRFLELLNDTAIVVIDEGLSVLDNYSEACDIIRNLNSHNIIITSHQLGFSEYNSLISCKLDEHGVSEIEVSR